MLKYIVMAALFCVLPGCVERTLPPPPPPMPFTVVWAPDEAPAVQVAAKTLSSLLIDCNGGKLDGKKIKDSSFPEMTFFSKSLEKGKTLRAGKLYYLQQTDVEFTTAVMFNLAVAKNGEIQECSAEKVIYRSK